MDQAIGDLVAGLKERGVLDNTLILFMSDNGGNAEAGPGGTPTAIPTTADVRLVLRRKLGLAAKTRRSAATSTYNHEGGIATPLIAHWPPGSQRKTNCAGSPRISSISWRPVSRRRACLR